MAGSGTDGGPARGEGSVGGILPQAHRAGELRLGTGRPIGSGLVEGTIKRVVNRRLMVNGATWKTGHVAPLVELVAAAGGSAWATYWQAP